jgi:hypothetical protein
MGVPELAGGAQPVEAGAALAQAVEMLLAGKFECHADATAHEVAGSRLAAHSVMLGLPEEPLAARIEKSQAQRGRGDFHPKVAGGQPRRVALRDLEGGGGPAPLATYPGPAATPPSSSSTRTMRGVQTVRVTRELSSA